MSGDSSSAVIYGHVNEMRGLLLGITSAVEIAREKYDHDHLDFEGLTHLVELANRCLFEMEQQTKPAKGGAG